MDTRERLRAVLVIAATAAGSAVVVSGSYELSKDRIAANQHARLVGTLESVLPGADHDNDVGLNPMQLPADPLLGTEMPTEAFVAARGARPTAVLLTAVAPDGYNGAIRLLVGISTEGVVTGVRVLEHRETPGLGDAIEIAKSDWISQFTGRSLGDPALERWTVKQENGAFDALTGATITPKAVIKAVKNALLYFRKHRDELIAAAREAVAPEGQASPQ